MVFILILVILMAVGPEVVSTIVSITIGEAVGVPVTVAIGDVDGANANVMDMEIDIDDAATAGSSLTGGS